MLSYNYVHNSRKRVKKHSFNSNDDLLQMFILVFYLVTMPNLFCIRNSDV